MTAELLSIHAAKLGTKGYVLERRRAADAWVVAGHQKIGADAFESSARLMITAAAHAALDAERSRQKVPRRAPSVVTYLRNLADDLEANGATGSEA